VRLGRLLTGLGERLDVYRAPVIRLPARVAALGLVLRRGIDSYCGEALLKLVEGPLRFDEI